MLCYVIVYHYNLEVVGFFAIISLKFVLLSH